MKIRDITEAPLYFYGSRCTVDCGGHRAGYAWGNAKPNKSCDSNSPSFTKGCLISKQHRQNNKNPNVLPVGFTVKNNQTGSVFVWRGAQWVDQTTGKVADRQTAKDLDAKYNP